MIDYSGGRLTPVEYGVITTPAGQLMTTRLKTIYEGVCRLIDQHKPDHMAIEELFFNTNAKTAITVGQARGVLMLAAINKGRSVFEYTPLQIKQAVAGYGRADKKQVQQMVKLLLNIPEIPKPDDAADAVAVAICHAHSHSSPNITCI